MSKDSQFSKPFFFLLGQSAKPVNVIWSQGVLAGCQDNQIKISINWKGDVARVDMSEWLRRQTRNLLGYACAGSNPAVDAFVFHFLLKGQYRHCWRISHSRIYVSVRYCLPCPLPTIMRQLHGHLLIYLRRLKWRDLSV